MIGLRRKTIYLATGVVAVGMIAVGCSSSSKPTVTSTASVGIPAAVNTYSASPSSTKVAGGTAYWAEAPGAPPDYIFPMTSAQVCGTNNVESLSAMLYRPLYWFGNDDSTNVDYNYSVGQAPVWSNGDKTVSISVNNWKWSDGESVTAADVALYISIYKGDPAVNYCGYVPPASSGEKFFPDNVVSMSEPNSSTLVLNLSQAYSPTWFLYNELGQVTPIPMSWDATSMAQVGTNDNANGIITSASQAEAVYNFLNAQAKDITSWGTSKLWTTVDGPFLLTSATSTGEVTMVPNPDFSGTPKASIAKFVEIPFTDNAAELTDLKTAGPGGLTVGFLPPEDAAQLTALEAEGYAPQSAYPLSFSYFPLNLNNPTFGPVFSQLYFRQAFQHLLDQQAWITAYNNGWGEVTAGPVPVEPPNAFSDAEESSDPIGFSIADAKSLLTSHGWTIASGVATCTSPGSAANECGAGVKSGLGLSFNLDYASGLPFLEDDMQDLASDAAQVGIKLQLTTHTFDSVISTSTQCMPTQPDCKWTAENWGAGWVYVPDYYPSGEELFLTGAEANYENYSDPTANSLILATTTASPSQATAAMDAYQNYMIQQLPVVFQPTIFGNPISGGPALVSSKLGGVEANTYDYITPEAWYFVK